MNIGTLLAVLALAGVFAAHSLAQFMPSKADWERADREIRRLPPNAFPQMPANLVQDLQRRGCTIPQEHFTKKPHNVLRGEFAKPGQTDWAVLCSINQVSSILVYWNGSETNPAELGKGEDRGLLQTLGEQGIGYSRQITAVGSQWILRYHSYHGGPKPPPIDHLGIEDAFVGKASVILYYSAGQWLRLQGAD